MDGVNWILLDDPSLVDIRNWEAVQALCLAGLTQPSDVFYEADSASPAAINNSATLTQRRFPVTAAGIRISKSLRNSGKRGNGRKSRNSSFKPKGLHMLWN